MSFLHRLVPALLVALLALLVTGCGDDPSPAESVPALSEHLEQVDEAISAGRYDDARTALDALVDVTARARVEGTLDADQADAILQAVGELGRRLPAADGKPAGEGSDEDDEGHGD